ncbi:MAG: phosphatase PAP2 family protein [Candidatus Thorarchaeota archaeon]
MFLFDPNLTNILRDILPGAGEFFKVITELGSEMFYIALLLVGYWSFRKRESILTIFVLLVSVVSNYWLKLAIANPRPEGVLYPGYQMAEGYSTPSGHAQNSMTLFGWFSLKVRTWWMILSSVVLVTLIGLSRVYLGVHYVGDVISGWAIGLLTVILLVYLEKPLEETLSRYKTEHLYTILFIVGLVMMVVATHVVPLPPSDNFGALGGLMMGVAVALPLEKRYVGFSTDVTTPRRIVRAVVGLVIVFAVMFGLAALISSTDPITYAWLRVLRYSVVALVGGFVWPAIFKKISL